MDVSIIIVNYNTSEILSNCLKSIYQYTKSVNFEVIVSDNGSRDNSVEMIRKNFPQVILIENHANIGFGKANNRGLRIATGKYIFYLNSDTILLNNAVKYFFDFWENSSDKKNLGALGSNLLDTKLGQNHSSDDTFPKISYSELFPFFRYIYGIYKLSVLNILFNKSLPKNKQYTYNKKTGEVKHIIGADLFVKNDYFAQFDEHYFMYYEETDIEYKMELFNKKRFIIDGPRIIHLDSSINQVEKSKDIVHRYASFSQVHKILSLIYYFSKHGTPTLLIGILKFLYFLLWCSPFLFTKNKKYFWRLLTI